MMALVCANKLPFLLMLLSYFLGSIPFGLIFVRLAGYGDIRKSGSGNIGATNVVRNTNKFLGLLTLICDGGKGALAVFIARALCHDYLVEICVGVAAVIGHIFPVWLRFKGGKGVATALAVFLMLDLKIGLVACISWLLGYFIIRISAAGALIAFAATPVVTYFCAYDARLIIANSLVCILVIIRHKDNIKSIIKSTYEVSKEPL